MNERIKELALQAKLRPALLLYYYHTIHGLTDTEQEELEQIEKFALLIVRECARLAIEKQTENDIAGIVSKNPAKDFAYALVEHFGVE